MNPDPSDYLLSRTGSSIQVEVPVRHPSYSLFVMLGAIAFAPLVMVLWLKTPRFNTPYLIVMFLALVSGCFLIWAIIIATRKIGVFNNVICIRSIFGAKEDDCDNVGVVLFGTDKTGGAVRIEFQGRMRHIGLDHVSMNRFLPALFASCGRAVIIDCDNMEVLSPESGYSPSGLEIQGAVAGFRKIVYFNLIQHLVAIIFVLVWSIVFLIRQGPGVGLYSAFLMLLSMCPVAIRSISEIKILRRLNGLIDNSVHASG